MTPSRSWTGVSGVLLAAVVAVLLAACSPGPSPSAPPSPAPSASPVTPRATVDGAFPVTVAHAFGETVVATAPKRVLAAGDVDEDTLLALDVLPVGMTRPPGGTMGKDILPWTARRLADVRARLRPKYTSVQVVYPPGGGGAPYDILAPDLIVAVGTTMDQAGYDEQSRLAPTIGRPAGTEPYETPWPETTRLIGRAVGKPVEAERLVTAVEARLAAAPARYPQLAGRTAVCLSLDTGKGSSYGYAVGGPDAPCPRMLALLGMRRVPALERGTADRPYPLTLQDVAAARPDVVVLENYEGVRNTVRSLLPPDLRTVDLDDGEQDGLGQPSVLSLPGVLDSFPPKLVRALR